MTSLSSRLLVAVFPLLLTVVPLAGALRQTSPLVTGLDHVIVTRLADVHRALPASGLMPVPTRDDTILLPPETTYGIRLECRDRY